MFHRESSLVIVESCTFLAMMISMIQVESSKYLFCAWQHVKILIVNSEQLRQSTPVGAESIIRCITFLTFHFLLLLLIFFFSSFNNRRIDPYLFSRGLFRQSIYRSSNDHLYETTVIQTLGQRRAMVDICILNERKITEGKIGRWRGRANKVWQLPKLPLSSQTQHR